MRIIHLLLVLCVVGSIASSQRIAPKSVPNLATPNLELKTEVLDQTYCSRSNLRLILRFAFRNSGSETLILFRYGTIIGRYAVSKNLKSMAKGKYIYHVRPFINPSMPPEIETGNPSEELFVLLQPGESYTTKEEAHLLTSDGSDSGHKLKPGERYFLQLQVATWFADPARARELSDRWRNTGTLWYGDVTSLPMELSIKPYDARDSCN